MTLPAEGTLLILDGMGIPLYSARGLTEQLSPIQAAAQMRRSINGVAYDLAEPSHKLYALKISCTDRRTPAIGGVWPGRIVTIHCVTLLSYMTYPDGEPERSVVPGSMFTEGDFTFYRPILTCMFVGQSPSVQTDEWAADVAWEMDFEEVQRVQV